MVSQNYGRWQQWLDRIRIDGCLALFGNSDDDDEPSCILPRRRQPCPNPRSRVTTNTFYLLLNSLYFFFLHNCREHLEKYLFIWKQVNCFVSKSTDIWQTPVSILPRSSLFEYQTWPNTFIFCTHSLKGLHDFSLYHVAQFIIADIFCAAADNRQKSNSCPLLSCQVSIVSWIMASISKEDFFGKLYYSNPMLLSMSYQYSIIPFSQILVQNVLQLYLTGFCESFQNIWPVMHLYSYIVP